MASLRTLIIATFRAPPTQYVMNLLRRLNPTRQLVSRASLFLTHSDYIYSLVCCVNINMGVFDCISSSAASDTYQDPVVVSNAYTLLKDLVALFNQMSTATQVWECVDALSKPLCVYMYVYFICILSIYLYICVSS